LCPECWKSFDPQASQDALPLMIAEKSTNQTITFDGSAPAARKGSEFAGIAEGAST